MTKLSVLGVVDFGLNVSGIVQHRGDTYISYMQRLNMAHWFSQLLPSFTKIVEMFLDFFLISASARLHKNINFGARKSK